MICGDGIFFDEMLQRGSLMNVHLLQLPLTWALQSALSAFAVVSPETTMKILSALAGGLGVAMTYVVARQVLPGPGQALAAASTLMVLAGYWFHSTATELHALHCACATILLLGLLRALRAADRGDAALDRSTLLCCAVGSLLTPLSHLSGIAMGLPILYALYKVPPPLRQQLLGAVAGGCLTFAAAFALSYARSQEFREAFAGSSAAATGLSMVGATAMIKQFLLYALPVSPLVPAGLAVLFRTAPGPAGLSLAWILAWPIVVVRHTDFLSGSYHVPTFPVQVLLGVVALGHLARSPQRAVLAVSLAALPMVGVLARDTAGLAHDNERATSVLCPPMDDLDLALGLWLLAATTLFLMAARQARRDQPRWLPLLPVATFLLTAPYVIPKLLDDPYRDRIREVSRLVGDRDLVLYLPESFSERAHWRRFFRAGNRERAHSPADVHYAAQNLQSYRGAVVAAWADHRRVWFVGRLDSYPALVEARGMAPHKGLTDYFAYLRRTARFARAPGTAEPIYELLPKP